MYCKVSDKYFKRMLNLKKKNLKIYLDLKI